MQDWSWILIIIMAATGFALLAAQAWRTEAKQRGQQAWQQLVRHRFPHNRPRMRRSDDDPR